MLSTAIGLIHSGRNFQIMLNAYIPCFPFICFCTFAAVVSRADGSSVHGGTPYGLYRRVRYGFWPFWPEIGYRFWPLLS